MSSLWGVWGRDQVSLVRSWAELGFFLLGYGQCSIDLSSPGGWLLLPALNVGLGCSGFFSAQLPWEGFTGPCLPAYTTQGPLSSACPCLAAAYWCRWHEMLGCWWGQGVRGALVPLQSQANQGHQDLREPAHQRAQEKLGPCNVLAFPLPYREWNVVFWISTSYGKQKSSVLFRVNFKVMHFPQGLKKFLFLSSRSECLSVSRLKVPRTASKFPCVILKISAWDNGQRILQKQHFSFLSFFF